jgi:hypothetical protein
MWFWDPGSEKNLSWILIQGPKKAPAPGFATLLTGPKLENIRNSVREIFFEFFLYEKCHYTVQYVGLYPRPGLAILNSRIQKNPATRHKEYSALQSPNFF